MVEGFENIKVIIVKGMKRWIIFFLSDEGSITTPTIEV